MKSRDIRGTVLGLLAALALLTGPVLALAPQPPELVSRNYEHGGPSVGLCGHPRFSAGGRYLGFNCRGHDLVPGDTNNALDVYVLDRQTGLVRRASLDSNGGEGELGYNSGSVRIVPSADGRVAAFGSTVRLHEDQLPVNPLFLSAEAAFVRYLDTGVTELVNRDAQGQAVTSSVRLMDALPERDEALLRTNVDLIDATTTTHSQLWVRNWVTGQVELITTRPDGQHSVGGAAVARFSANGRYVVFVSEGIDLGPPAREFDRNVFVRDRLLGTTERVTYPYAGGEFSGPPVTMSPGEPPKISTDGRHVLFSSSNRELFPAEFPGDTFPTQVYLVDRQTGQIELISRNEQGNAQFGTNVYHDMSNDGRYVAFHMRSSTGEAGFPAFFVLDRDTGERANITEPLGPQLELLSGINIAMAGDGSHAAFSWIASNPDLPELLGRMQIYSVDLGTGDPPSPPQPRHPVPAGSPWTWLLLAATMLLAARCRPSRSIVQVET